MSESSHNQSRGNPGPESTDSPSPVSWLCSYEGYHRFTNEDGTKYGSFEIYWSAENNPGWYWQSCQPGCLPDSEPHGPFITSYAAYEDANPHATLEDVE